ncbi:MAG TPA: phospholipase D family protein [Burkholderiaceae bacterium]|nr:phospholipase D family protein [Burkholderiaceae bacterium]
MAARFAALIVAVLAAFVGGCAGVPPAVERTPSKALVAPAEAPLAGAAREARLPVGQSGVWPLMQASYALDARLALIEHATTSLDLQYYLIGDDSVGRLLLRALRDAAGRGVRVRLLVDDLYTIGTDRLLLGLAATPNVEVRLFNPFITARDSSTRRLLALALDFKRLNHRMHNKLFVADGAMAVVGGRNLADEYFLRGTQGNFIDFDVLLAGAVVPELSGWFDLYWNSPAAYPVHDVVRATAGGLPAPDAARALFESVTAGEPRPDAPMAPDFFGAPAFSTGLAQHALEWLPAAAGSYADSPAKIDPANNSIAIDDTLTHRFLLLLSETRSEMLLFSPYFVPGAEALARIRALRERGVEVRVVTNSLAVSDEPLVSVGLERHQIELLKMGVDLYEISSTRLKLDHTLKGLLGSSTGRLHAKMGFQDRRRVLVGSMNLDPRSARINTEIGVRIESPRLAEMVLAAFKVDAVAGVYQVRLRPNGAGVRWVAVDADSPEDLDVDPDTSVWQRLRLLLLSLFVPESQL